ncbi:MAG: PaaI family thioesterase [Microthrixaceae bacterium]
MCSAAEPAVAHRSLPGPAARDRIDTHLALERRAASTFSQRAPSGRAFAGHLRITGLEADTDHVVTAAHWQPEHCGTGGVLHGGYLMALADSAGATLAFLNLADGASTATVESKTNFFRPVTAGSVTATATTRSTRAARPWQYRPTPPTPTAHWYPDTQTQIIRPKTV